MQVQSEYREIPCPVCGGRDKQMLYPDTIGSGQVKFDYNFTPQHFKTYRIVRCKGCSHVFSSPLPVNLWENYVSVTDEVYLRNQNSRYLTAEKILERIRRFASGGRLLDVGCATGDFINIAQKYYQVQGLEISQWSAKIAKDRGFVIHEKLLEGVLDNEGYDVITLWGVIEHFENPLTEVKHLFRLLKPNGIVSLWTGDVDSLTSRLMGFKWWYFQGQHIQMFTEKSLCKVFIDAGFKKEWIGVYPYVTSMESVFRSLGRYPVVGKMARATVGRICSPKQTVTIKLPGEMFAFFRKEK